jgi:hypothetical protein
MSVSSRRRPMATPPRSPVSRACGLRDERARWDRVPAAPRPFPGGFGRSSAPGSQGLPCPGVAEPQHKQGFTWPRLRRLWAAPSGAGLNPRLMGSAPFQRDQDLPTDGASETAATIVGQALGFLTSPTFHEHALGRMTSSRRRGAHRRVLSFLGLRCGMAPNHRLQLGGWLQLRAVYPERRAPTIAASMTMPSQPTTSPSTMGKCCTGRSHSR